MSGDPGPEKPPSIRRLVVRTVGTLAVALLIGYPLSVGPAFYFILTHYSQSDEMGQALTTFDKVYGPLVIVVKKTPGLEPIFSQYVDFWIALGNRRNQPRSN